MSCIILNAYHLKIPMKKSCSKISKRIRLKFVNWVYMLSIMVSIIRCSNVIKNCYSIAIVHYNTMCTSMFIHVSKQLSLAHMRTLQMDEDVLCVRCSPDQRLLAVSLLDNTVKVFFLDTLKVHLCIA